MVSADIRGLVALVLMYRLDCTLRDGGYYTNWVFSDKFVHGYLQAIDSIGVVDYVELGFKGFDNADTKRGKYADVPYSIYESVKLEYPDRNFGVMCSVDYDNFDIFESERFDFVRIMSKPGQIAKANLISKQLQEYGIKTFINITHISDYDRRELSKQPRVISDVIYIADTFGKLTPNNIEEYLAVYPAKKLGVHLHNNKNMATANAHISILNNVKWFDTTIMGFGRGAGNLSLESLLVLLDVSLSSQIEEFILTRMNSLYKRYSWGYNLQYEIGARNGVHPEETQKILTKEKKR